MPVLIFGMLRYLRMLTYDLISKVAKKNNEIKAYKEEL